MAATTQTKTKLTTQERGDTNWHTAYNAGVEAFEERWRYRGAVAPNDPFIGMLWIDTSTAGVDIYKVCLATDNVTWQELYRINRTTGVLTLPATAEVPSVSPVGKHTIPISAASLTPRTTNGPARGLAETSTNKVMEPHLAFDASTAEYAQIRIPMPKGWNEGTIQVQFIWRASGTGNVRWGARAVCIGNDDAADAAFGTAQYVTDSVTATGDVMHSSYTSAITPGGTPAAEDELILEVFRDAANAADTCAADARLLGVRVTYTIDAPTDA